MNPSLKTLGQLRRGQFAKDAEWRGGKPRAFNFAVGDAVYYGYSPLRWTIKHLLEDGTAQLAHPLAGYAAGEYSDIWPFDEEWWKPEMPRRNLIKAAALIVAEIERLDRLAAKEAPEPDPDILREDRDERDRLAREDRD